MQCIKRVLLKILRKTIHCLKRVLIWSFSDLYFPAFVLNTERYSVFGHFSRSDFVKLILAANSEPWVILFFSWNLDYLSLDAVVLQFLKNSSSVFFKSFQIESNLSFLQFRISFFLEIPHIGYFRPATIVFS